MQKKLHYFVIAFVATFFFINESVAQLQMQRAEHMVSAPSERDPHGEWIHWDDGENWGSVGVGSPNIFYVASRWESNDLVSYEGMWITKLRFYINDVPNATVAKIWQGIDETSLEEIYSQPFTATPESWVEVELDPSSYFAIDPGNDMELWFGYEVDDPGEGVFTAGRDEFVDHDGKGNKVKLGVDGDWASLSDFGLEGDWNIHIYLMYDGDDLPPADPLEMFTIVNKTGADVPAEIGEEGNARSAALYLNRYVIVPSREGGPAVWVWDAHNPDEAPFALNPGDGYEGGLFPVNYVQTVGEHIYVSNMSLASDEAHPFKIYRWDGLDAAPELVLSTDAGYGRLGDSFSIIGDPAGDGLIIAHVNSGGEGQRTFRKWNFVDGVNQNPDEAVLITIEGDHNMNSYGVYNAIEGEDELFLITGNVMGIAIADISGQIHAYIDSEIVPTRTMDPRVFYYNGNRYLSYVVNKEWDDEGAYYDVIDISMGEDVAEAFSMITSIDDLDARRAHSFNLGAGAAFLSSTHQASHTDDGEIMVLSHVVARGFVLESTAPLFTEPEAPEGLVHYWHFNDQVITDDDEVPADYSAVGQGMITYPGTGDGYMDFRTHRAADPVSDFNLQMGQEPEQGAVLRVRNPADTRELIFAAPSTGYKDLVVTFATTRTGNGAQEQEFYFSADNGATWVMVGDAYEITELDPDIEGYGYVHKVIDLSEYGIVNNNEHLHFKILAVGEGADNTSGNQRFDNFTLEGTPMAIELVHYWHFNDEVITGDDEVPADFSAVGEGVITYPGTGDGYMDFRTHRPADPVSNFNLRMDQEPDQGAVLRVRNPADTRELIVAAPSTGYEDLTVTFATTRTGNGAQQQEFYYSADNGASWVMVGDVYDIPELDPELEGFGYLHKVIDLTDYPEVNNNHELHFKILAVGEGAGNDSGNQRFDNFTLDGYFIETDLPASKLSIVAVNDGDPVYVDEPFSISIQVLNDDNIPTAVEEDVPVTLSLATGNGNLGGNLNGVIAEGSASLVIEGILYDVAEAGVSIHVDAPVAAGLEPATSDEFEVHLRTYMLTLESFPPGAGELIGGGEYEEGAEVPVSAVANEGFVFTHWSLDDEEVTTDAEFVFTMPAEDVTLTANFEMLGDFLLIHYWHFNNEEMIDEEDYKVVSDFSLVGQGEITYPGEGDGYMDFRSHRESDPVSNFNLRLGEEPDQGAVLRVRNPAITRELIIAAPSTGFADLVVTFATTRTENGSQAQQFYFSADAGETWVPVGDAYDIPFIEDEEGIYLHKEIDLSEYEEVNDNPDLHFKILFVGEGNDNPSGNNRFDNLTLDGWSIGDVSIEDVSVTEISMQVYPNPTNGIFNIDVDQPDMLIRIYDMHGKLVYQRAMSGSTLSIDATGFQAGLYIIQGISSTDNTSVSKRLLIR